MVNAADAQDLQPIRLDNSAESGLATHAINTAASNDDFRKASSPASGSHGLPEMSITMATSSAARGDSSSRGDNNFVSANTDSPNDIVHRWYGYGDGGGGRSWHNVTREQWQRDSHDAAVRETNNVVRDIGRHSSHADLQQDAQHLAEALKHAKAHMTTEEFDKLIKDLPQRTGNKVYDDAGKLKVNVPYSLRDPLTVSDPVVFDPANARSAPYDMHSFYPGIY